MQHSVTDPLNVLVVRPGALGDTLVALPALADLNHRVHVFFAGRRPGLHFLARGVRRVFDFESSGWHHLFSEDTANPAVHDVRPDTVVGFMRDGEGIIYRNLSRTYPGAFIRLFPSLPGEGRAGHVARYIAECLEEAGLPVDPDRVMNRCEEAPLMGGSSARRPRTKLVLHPGSGSAAKNHPIRFWAELMQTLGEEDGFRFLDMQVLLGPAEMGLRPALEHVFRGRDVTIVDRPDHDTLAATLETSALYLGHDSGISHLAAMFGAPTIALFRTGNPDRWRPLGPCVTVIWSPRADAGLIRRVAEAGKTLLNRGSALP